MLHIIFKILAVIGIIILCLLGFLLLSLFAALFVPVRYRAAGVRSAEKTALHVKLTWFLHLLTVEYAYPDPGEVKVRIFGRTVRAGQPPDEGKGEAAHETVPPAAAFPADKSSRRDDAAKRPEDDVKDGNTNVPSGAETKEYAEKGRPLERFAERILGFFRKIKYTFLEIYAKIKRIANNLEYYRELLHEEETRLVFGRCLKRVGKVLGHIRPSRLDARILVGTGAPDTTGYVLAAYGMFHPFLGDHIRITADFERAVLEGEFFLKGRIAMSVLLANAASLYFDRQLRLFIGKLKREDA